MVDSSANDIYLASLYWVITTVTTVGYGDILPANDTERVFCILVMSGGVFFYSYTIGSITSLIFDFEKQKVKINSKLLILQEITREFKLSSNFENKIKKALKYGQLTQNKEQFDMINSLPRRLALNLNLIVNKKVVEKSNRFFKNKPLSFITSILDHLRPLKISDKEILFEKLDLSTELYFITKGEVCLYDTYLNNDISFDDLKDGEFFGEVEVILDENRAFSSRTVKISELLVLEKIHLIKALGPFENLQQEMIIQARRRKAIYENKCEKAMLEFVSNRTLAKSINNDKFEEKKIITDTFIQKKLGKIRNKLSGHALKMVDAEKKMIDELKFQLKSLEAEIILFKSQLASK